MHVFDGLWQAIFWGACAVLVYIYAGFPICLAALSRRRREVRPAELRDHELPTISFIVAAYNEELVIEKKVLNGLSLDYPPEKLTFVFVSDSNDGTNDILRRYESDRVHVHTLPQRSGKVRAIRTIIPACAGEILVFSDANTYYRRDSLRKLVRHFVDPQVGVTTGDVRILPSEEKFGAGEGFYYRYERALQVLESRYWSTVAIDGAMYAVRRKQFIEPPETGVNDDLAAGMNVALEGLRIIYDPEAIADEPPTPSDGMEFRRKVRIVAYGIQAFLNRQASPPVRHWRLFWVYMSHKVLRWLAPVFLVIALAASVAAAAAGGPFWAAVVALQIMFYGLALAAWRFHGAAGLIFRVPYYFSMVNLAALFGIVRGLRRGQPSVWARTERKA